MLSQAALSGLAAVASATARAGCINAGKGQNDATELLDGLRGILGGLLALWGWRRSVGHGRR